MKLAVAMSIYKNDRLEHIEEAVNSILLQTYELFDLFIQVDGSVNEKVRIYLNNLKKFENVYICFYPENKGLAFQLNQIISKVLKGDYLYLARMDADDVSLPTRFEKQVEFFEKSDSIAVIGTNVIEFKTNTNNEFEKKMSVLHDDMLSQIIKRCPFNHPTVMFNLGVIRANDLVYNSKLKNTQDYFLWIDLLSKGYKFSNIDEVLLRFRVDENFYSRRGFKKALNDLYSRYYAMKTLKIWSVKNITYSILLFILRVSPSFIKKAVYQNFR